MINDFIENNLKVMIVNDVLVYLVEYNNRLRIVFSSWPFV